jgi:hypothetical protein
MLTQELLAEAAVIATQALSAGPAFHSRSSAVALVVRKQHLTQQYRRQKPSHRASILKQ